MTSPSEAEALLVSLLKCLKASIHTPKRNQDDLRFSNELAGSTLSKESMELHNNINVRTRTFMHVVCRMQNSLYFVLYINDKSNGPMAALLIEAALSSSSTDYEAVQGCLVCIDRLSMEWPNQTVNAIMKGGYSRIFLTLSHAKGVSQS